MDLAIAMMVIGLIAARLISDYNDYAVKKTYYNTVSGLSSLQTALENYYFQHGSYPCPANSTLGPDNLDYGKAQDCEAALTDPVVSGMVPFKDLNIPMEYVLDGWSAKYEYAVTRALTNKATYDPGGGKIFIDGIADDGISVVPIAPYGGLGNKAHYVLVSHGINMIGAYGVDGTLLAPCSDAGAMARESENCDADNRYFLHLGARSLSRGTTYFDDLIVYAVDSPSRIWVPSEEGQDIVSDNILIGIGTDTPEYDLDVAGNVLADDGDIWSTEVCEGDDAHSGNCFNAQLIGGTGHDCGDGSAVTGIAYGDIICEPKGPARTTTEKCPGSNNYVIGIDASGGIICSGS
jgi:hypothetical protein